MHNEMYGVRNAIMGLLVIVLLLGQNGASLMQNLLRIDLIHTWMHIKPLTWSDMLNDDIPDKWSVQSWGGATAIYRIVTGQVLSGQHAISIQRTNIIGGVALVQDVTVPATSQMLLSVHSKGVGGAIQVLGDGDTLGWIDIPATDPWCNYRLTFQVPSNVNTIRLLLRAGELGVIYFDEAYLGIASDGRAESNLLGNSGFEEDGVSGDPLIWWSSEVAAPVKQNDLPRGIAYMNIGDMLNGNIPAIQLRARELGINCSENPAMTGWLMARGEDFEQAGGVFSREQLYHLAIKLAPNCPQPYVALAKLYKEHLGFWRAAELYHQAAELSGDTIWRARYFFEEGLLHVRYTGEMAQAISALQKADEVQGWEPGYWYKGAAAFFLGQAFESSGRIEEARLAYQRAITCTGCGYHSVEARKRLEALSTSEP